MAGGNLASVEKEVVRYDDQIVRSFVLATLFWGAVGMLIGVVLALELAFWPANGGIPWLTFGRLRPVHTNAVIFAFAGNTIFAGVYYSLQRLCKARTRDVLSRFHYWAWQLLIVAAAVTLLMGYTVSKEYAELEWPLDIGIAVVWIAFGWNLFDTLARRRERHIYVAIWFYIATILAVAVLHVVNSLNLPVSLFKSYPVFAGVQDALVQWWYGHNAVAFFLTTPFLGLMYYFLPKAAERPVFSYRLSIVHFWSLVFIYIWAGPHHLLYTSLPDWAQTFGMVFSLMLIAPSWGGMINGLLTLRGAWDRLRTDTVLKFFVAAVTFYGMSTFEGPMMSIKTVNALSHYTDWTIGHVHSGALGWNGFMAFGMIYWLVPRLWRVPVYSPRLMSLHFWLGTLGIVLYMTSMWAAGITQGLMWRAFTEDGLLKYPEFISTVVRLIPFYWVRMVGGLMYLIGTLLCSYNVFQSIKASRREHSAIPDTEAQALPARLWRERDEGPLPPNRNWHYRLEGKALAFSVLTMIAILIGGMAEIIPLVAIESNVPTIASVHPYTPLELEGRDIYVREGCYTCHSQMVRPFREEVVRYGEYSKAGEFVYDRPFQFGSKRTGPDLHRVGGKYPDFWHYRHFENPRSTSPGSIMPAYPWFYDNELDTSLTSAKIAAFKTLGAPYSDEEVVNAVQSLKRQARSVADALEKEGVRFDDGDLASKEIIAMIAYMQRLGTDIAIDR